MLLLFLVTMMLPEEVLAIPLSLVLGDLPLLHVNLIGTLAGMILPVGAWGFSIMVMTEFMKEIPRRDRGGRPARRRRASSGCCGRSSCRCASPRWASSAIFGFMMIWDQYLLPLIAAKTPPTTP